MVKYATNITRESIVDVEGTVAVPENPVESCTQSQVLAPLPAGTCGVGVLVRDVGHNVSHKGVTAHNVNVSKYAASVEQVELNGGSDRTPYTVCRTVHGGNSIRGICNAGGAEGHGDQVHSQGGGAALRAGGRLALRGAGQGSRGAAPTVLPSIVHAENMYPM